MTIEEIIAVVVSAAGVWLTARRSLWNYPFSLLSVVLYAHIFYSVRLYSDMALQGIFAAALIYGLAEWTRHRERHGTVRVSHATLTEVVAGAVCGVALALVVGWYTSTHTDAAMPWLDAAMFAGSLVASWWSARRRIENWLLWIVVDCIYIGMYVAKGLLLTALLYAAFVGLAVVGLRRWRIAYAAQQDGDVTSGAAAGCV